MADLVNPAHIEQIVGTARHATWHLARAVSAAGRVFILHSQQCLETRPDLRECPWSHALDRGIDRDRWEDYQDQAVRVTIVYGRLVPSAYQLPAPAADRPTPPPVVHVQPEVLETLDRLAVELGRLVAVLAARAAAEAGLTAEGA